MSKPLDAYLPKKGEMRNAQGNVPKELYTLVDTYRKEHDVTWNELFTAMFQRLVDETKRKKS